MTTTTTLQQDTHPRVSAQLARQIGEQKFSLWFERSARFDYIADDHALLVVVPSRFVADRLRRHFADVLRQVAAEALSLDAADPPSLRIDVQPDRFASDKAVPAAPVNADPRSASSIAAPRPQQIAPARAAFLEDPALAGKLRHDLADFVTGPSNELAFAAAQRLANPEATEMAQGLLLLHGGCGLGKTHLLQGVCKAFLQHRPDAKVLYTTGEQFTNRYITAVRSNQLDSFRKWMRSLDLLAVDDVHFLSNKTATQKEFQHSFDQIQLGGARIVLASDAHPKLIKQFSEPLVSRLIHGLVVEVQQPDEQTRRELVWKLAERRKLLLQPAAADVLAARAGRSVREIAGNIAKLHALAFLPPSQGHGPTRVVGRALVDQLFAVSAVGRPRKPVRFETLTKIVCDSLHVAYEQVAGSSRHRHVVLARSVLIHLTRELTTMSYPEIAAAMGKRNHSTVVTAAQRMARQLKANDPLLLPGRPSAITPVQLVEELLHEARTA